MSESRIDRIKRMEAYLDEADRVLDAYEKAAEEYRDVQKKIRMLEKYYTSGQWQQDYVADEAGKLPADLKRGVLSQDAIGDLLDRNKELLERKHPGE